MKANPSQDSVRTTLNKLVGVRLGPYLSYNPVSRTQVWQWCSAMGDRNPLFLDDDYRATTEFSGTAVVAPPAMMQMWTMRDINMKYCEGSTEDEPFQIIYALEDLGYVGNVAVSYEITFHHYLVDGDQAHHYKEVASISDLKQTTLGDGYFFTDREQYFDQSGALFAEALVTYFQFRPRTSGDHTQPAPVTRENFPRAGAAIAPADSYSPTVATVGQALPGLTIPITHELIVGGAIATQDFTPVHHNVEAARAAGAKDIFMSILTTTGLSARYLSDWAGPESRLRRLKLRLLAQNCPGDTMIFSGLVNEVMHGERGVEIAIGFQGDNSLGQHVVGEAVLGVPE